MRLGAYMYAALYISIIRLVSFFFPKLKRLIYRYKCGETGKPLLLVCIISAAVLDSILLAVFAYANSYDLKWIAAHKYEFLFLYPVLVFVGWFSFIVRAGYEAKERQP